MGANPDGHGVGMMRLVAEPSTVPSGAISLRVFNAGPMMTHEVVVLPLNPGQSIGQRPTHPDGKIDEAGSLGEVSRSCGTGSGDGILPGAAGWTTLPLHPGRYELRRTRPHENELRLLQAVHRLHEATRAPRS